MSSHMIRTIESAMELASLHLEAICGSEKPIDVVPVVYLAKLVAVSPTDLEIKALSDQIQRLSMSGGEQPDPDSDQSADAGTGSQSTADYLNIEIKGSLKTWKGLMESSGADFQKSYEELGLTSDTHLKLIAVARFMYQVNLLLEEAKTNLDKKYHPPSSKRSKRSKGEGDGQAAGKAEVLPECIDDVLYNKFKLELDLLNTIEGVIRKKFGTSQYSSIRINFEPGRGRTGQLIDGVKDLVDEVYRFINKHDKWAAFPREPGSDYALKDCHRGHQQSESKDDLVFANQKAAAYYIKNKTAEVHGKLEYLNPTESTWSFWGRKAFSYVISFFAKEDISLEKRRECSRLLRELSFKMTIPNEASRRKELVETVLLVAGNGKYTTGIRGDVKQQSFNRTLTEIHDHIQRGQDQVARSKHYKHCRLK